MCVLNSKYKYIQSIYIYIYIYIYIIFELCLIVYDIFELYANLEVIAYIQI